MRLSRASTHNTTRSSYHGLVFFFISRSQRTYRQRNVRPINSAGCNEQNMSDDKGLEQKPTIPETHWTLSHFHGTLNSFRINYRIRNLFLNRN